MRLALVISSLGPGGAERVMAQLAGWWAAEGRAVSLITFDAAEPYHPLDARVRRVALAMQGASAHPLAAAASNFARVRRLRQALVAARPDAVVSFMPETNVTTLLACVGLEAPVIVSERIDPAAHEVNGAWAALRRLVYPRADALVAQTERALAYFPPALRRLGRVIPNPVTAPGRAEPAGRRTAVAVGRLAPQKGFDLLLQAFAQAAPPDWRLTIWGEGGERPALEALRDRLGLGERAALPGLTPAPSGWIEGAGLFVLPSRYEGFPNVLVEAMAAGLPALAADCPSGPREIVSDGVDGVLCRAEDVGALADALRRLMQDEPLRLRLAAAAAESARRFAPERVMPLWTETVERAIARRKRAA